MLIWKPMKKSARRSREEFSAPPKSSPKRKPTPTRLRIVSGEFRGRKIAYNGDPATRPMKERTREAVFSLLGGKLDATFAVDLFGGTGILTMETVSRGAVGGLILELARSAVSTIVANLQLLGISDRVEVRNVDTLRWLRNAEQHGAALPVAPWVIFCCPPYRMWHASMPQLAEGLTQLVDASPPGSRLVCETEFDIDLPAAMPHFEWDIRKYSPALIGIAEKPAGDAPSAAESTE